MDDAQSVTSGRTRSERHSSSTTQTPWTPPIQGRQRGPSFFVRSSKWQRESDKATRVHRLSPMRQTKGCLLSGPFPPVAAAQATPHLQTQCKKTDAALSYGTEWWKSYLSNDHYSLLCTPSITRFSLIDLTVWSTIH